MAITDYHQRICTFMVSNSVKKISMYSLPRMFWSPVNWISSNWVIMQKSLANLLAYDQQIIIHGEPYISLYFIQLTIKLEKESTLDVMSCPCGL